MPTRLARCSGRPAPPRRDRRRLPWLVDGEVAGGARQQRFDPLRRQAVGRGEIRDRLLVLLVGLIDQSAAIQRLHVVGIECERAVEFRQRLFGLAGLGERLAARSVALGVAGACPLIAPVGFCSAACGLSLSDPHDPRSNEQPPSGKLRTIARAMGTAVLREAQGRALQSVTAMQRNTLRLSSTGIGSPMSGKMHRPK